MVFVSRTSLCKHWDNTVCVFVCVVVCKEDQQFLKYLNQYQLKSGTNSHAMVKVTAITLFLKLLTRICMIVCLVLQPHDWLIG